MRHKYERDDVSFPPDNAYKSPGYPGIAWRILGWELDYVAELNYISLSDEEILSSDDTTRTGAVVAVMIGDDKHFLRQPHEMELLNREEFCSVCGQIGCSHNA